MSNDEQERVADVFKEVIGNDKITIKQEPHSPEDPPLVITEDEFLRRWSEMSKMGGGMPGMGDMPASYNVVINTNHKLVKKVVDTKEPEDKKKVAKQLYDLARLSKNILTGKDLNDFVARSMEIIG